MLKLRIYHSFSIVLIFTFHLQKGSQKKQRVCPLFYICKLLKSMKYTINSIEFCPSLQCINPATAPII